MGPVSHLRDVKEFGNCGENLHTKKLSLLIDDPSFFSDLFESILSFTYAYMFICMCFKTDLMGPLFLSLPVLVLEPH